MNLSQTQLVKAVRLRPSPCHRLIRILPNFTANFTLSPASPGRNCQPGHESVPNLRNGRWYCHFFCELSQWNNRRKSGKKLHRCGINCCEKARKPHYTGALVLPFVVFTNNFTTCMYSLTGFPQRNTWQHCIFSSFHLQASSSYASFPESTLSLVVEGWHARQLVATVRLNFTGGST